MKKIIKPLEREEAVYYSDFSGKILGEFGVPVELKISCGYGSKYDGSDITLHLDDNDLEKIILTFKQLISDDFKKEIKKKIEKYEEDYDSSMQMRDWDHCDRAINTLWFFKNILDIKQESYEK
jgi:hypothetical protein